MQGRLKHIKFHAREDGSLVVQAVVKTHAAKIARYTVGVARDEGQLLALIEECNKLFPNPARQRVGGGTQ